MNRNNELIAAAEAVIRQTEEAQGLFGIPVDPDVADYMGAFAEEALGPDDLSDDRLLSANDQGEVIYEER